MLRILQGSDMHFGRPHDARAAESFLDAAGEVDPDIVVFAGDFTQRAKVREYRMARRFLERFGDRPVVVTPGNHDVALYRFWERLAYPFRNYRRHIHPELDYVVRVEGATFVSLNTAAPRRAIINGRLDASQLEFAERALARSPETDLKCVVMHHAFAPAPDEGGEPTVPGSESALDRIGDMGVEIVFGGHLHRAYVVRAAGDGPVVVHSGTVTSSRGREAEERRNSFNVVDVDGAEIRVTRHLREAGDVRFEPTWTEHFGRRHASTGTAEGGVR